MKLYKYHGAGNDFIIVDGRIMSKDELSRMTAPAAIIGLCDRHFGIGADGLMVLLGSDKPTPHGPKADFRMLYFNSDGSGGMMCGNGGRCIVAFAADCGIKPSATASVQGETVPEYWFEAPDTNGSASILSAQVLESGTANSPLDTPEPVKTVRLRLRDASPVTDYTVLDDVPFAVSGSFVDTGTRHFVLRVDGVASLDIEPMAKPIRWSKAFAPAGTNVNFIQTGPEPGTLHIRTFEKGVEGETCACGTGIAASAIVASHWGIEPLAKHGSMVKYRLLTAKNKLEVEFDSASNSDVFLTGPAERVAVIEL